MCEGPGTRRRAPVACGWSKTEKQNNPRACNARVVHKREGFQQSSRRPSPAGSPTATPTPKVGIFLFYDEADHFRYLCPASCPWAADDIELLAHGPQVGGQPVDQDTVGKFTPEIAKKIGIR